MKYDDLLLEAYNFREELSDNYSKLKNLLENNPHYIEISRLCLEKSVKEFIEETNVSKRIYSKIIKGEKIPDKKIIENINSYIVENFTEIKKEKIIELTSKNWVCIDNIHNCKKWMKYNIKYNFITRYFGLFFLFYYFSLIGGFFLYVVNSKLGLIYSSFCFASLLYLIFIRLSRSPQHNEVDFFMMYALLKNNSIEDIESIKKYANFTSQKYRFDEREIREYLFDETWCLIKIFNELGKTIQENILPHIKEENSESISQFFDMVGRYIVEPTIDYYIKLRDFLEEVKQEYAYSPYLPLTKVEKFVSFFARFRAAKKFFLLSFDFSKFLFIVLLLSFSITYILCNVIPHTEDRLNITLFSAIAGIISLYYLTRFKKFK